MPTSWPEGNHQWTFGGPRIGNHNLADFITNQQQPNSVYRATHASDLIPKVPTSFLRDWSQPSPEYWINQETGKQVTPSVVKHIEGINNKTGNAGTAVSLKWSNPDHGWYFGNMSVCVPPSDASWVQFFGRWIYCWLLIGELCWDDLYHARNREARNFYLARQGTA